MVQPSLNNITISRFVDFFAGARHVGMSDDFHIMDVSIKDSNRILAYPFRMDAYMVIYCVKGHIRLSVNLSEYDLKEGMVFLNYPGNIMRVNKLMETENEDLRYVCVLMSRSFVNNLMVDVNKILTQNLSLMDRPTLLLNDTQIALLKEHVNMMISLVQSDAPFKLESVRSVLTSLFYYVAGAWVSKNEVHVESEKTNSTVSTRTKAVFDQFIKLVKENYMMYRNVGFYSDRLSLTPKYLSRIIKEASGRSAPEWIDDYVILESKNLLKYSGLAIKEIVYKLNFPSQSVFYKFFKARTGMTPTEYKNA